MIRLIVFGTGSSADSLLADLTITDAQIRFFSDNNEDKIGTHFHGTPVISAEQITQHEYDYIFIASSYSIEIEAQLLGYGIPREKILIYDIKSHLSKLEVRLNEVRRKLVRSRKRKSIKKIALINYNNSNYHGYALAKYIPPHMANNYKVDLLTTENRSEIRDYDVIVSSHLDGIYEDSYINIELWHAFILKQVGANHKGVKADAFNRAQLRRMRHTQLIMSYSQLHSTFFNASFYNTGDKYRITGMPRNDLLFEPGARNTLEHLTERRLGAYSIVFYLPTWRQGRSDTIDLDQPWNKLFDLECEDESGIRQYLEENNLFIVIKPHPFEKNEFQSLPILSSNRIFVISEELLIEKNIHLYEVIPCASFVITDYSSVYVDLLLIDIPTIFIINSIIEYNHRRGFVIDPYTHFITGPIVNNLDDLTRESRSILAGQDKFQPKRTEFKEVAFKHTDNQSSARVWHEIHRCIKDHE